MARAFELICQDTWPTSNPTINFPGCCTQLTRNEVQSLSITIPDDVKKRMEHVSQIGLKDEYLGKTADEHVRWNHAKGVYTLGLIWLHALYAGDRIPKHLISSPYPVYSSARVFVGYSLLLHDYGHLPFSHLLEEAIHNINWVPLDSGQSSLEYTVLRDRLQSNDPLSKELLRTVSQSLPSECSQALRKDPMEVIIQLTHGWCGLPWLQAIVNSPIDADKIDYIRRDQDILESVGFPVRTRLALYSKKSTNNLPWLTDFLSDQYVNCHGLLCLPGRSSTAAVDLWKERLLLYERFYLAPSVRAADRITLEIVQQFVIRSVMSENFRKALSTHPKFAGGAEGGPLDLKDFGRLLSDDSKSGSVDPITSKYRAVVALLNRISALFGDTGERDWECFSFMRDCVLAVKTTSQKYHELLEIFVKKLEEIRSSGLAGLSKFAETNTGDQPVRFHRGSVGKVREVVRSFQHQYFEDVLIDVCVMPRVLSLAPPPRVTTEIRYAGLANVLVPKGPVEQWSSANRALEPLGHHKMESLEKPFGRIMVISPPEWNRARASYIYERLVGELRQRGLLQEEGDKR
jgi:hypothetical protein